MLSYLWLVIARFLVGDGQGRHAKPWEPKGFWDEYDSESIWLSPDEADGQESFPIVCSNGCPEGYLGRHKFSCSLAGVRQTSAERAIGDDHPSADDLDSPWVRPYLPRRITHG
jgi:hypothetical protein